jgi:hypothetical protein
MRIAFLCGGLGFGGVADYTRHLAAALKPHGVESLIVGLADRDASEVTRSSGALAVPGRLSWPARIEQAEAALAAFDPDWVSLQFVPFAFHGKGVVALEARWLARLLAGRRAQIMMHELWVEPLPRPVALRRRLLRAAQRASILRLLRGIRPELLHTSNAVYLDLLEGAGFRASLLPLFGNVAIEPRPDRAWLDAALAASGHDRRRDPLLFGFFGGVDPEWDGRELFDRLAAALGRIGRTGLVLSAGAASGMPERLRRWAAGHPQIGVLALGIQPAERVSAYLQALDFGLTSYPYALIGKSSSVKAMLEHGLPVIVPWGDLRPDLPAIETELEPLVLRPGGDLVGFIVAPPERRIRGSHLNRVAARLLAEITPHEAPEKGVKASRLLG